MTNFAIIRMNKIKTQNDFIHLQRHNFRMNNTPNADTSRTHLNENLRDFEEVKKVFDDFFIMRMPNLANEERMLCWRLIF